MAGGDGAGDKRKKQWQSGAQDNNKRHKGHIASASTAKGSSGILVTCDRTKERQSVRDALNILNELADKMYPKVSTEADDQAAGEGEAETDDKAEENEASSTVQQMLQDEIKALKADVKDRKTGRFTPLDTGVRGVLLIKVLDKNISAVELVRKILEDVEETKEFSSRFINRIIPLETIGYSTVEEIKTAAEPMIKAFIDKFTTDEATKDTPVEYAVEMKRRNCTRLESMEVIEMLAGLVGEEHKVNLTKPNVVILVEVFKNTFGLSIVTGFHKYRKFNVRSIIDPPVSVKEGESKDGVKSAAVKDEDVEEDATKNEAVEESNVKEE